MNISEFTKREKNAHLFSIKYKGIPLWELVRFDIFNEYVDRCKIDFKIPLYLKFKRWTNTIIGIIFSNPLFFLSRKDILVIRASRKSNANGILVDPYTFDFEKKFSNKGIYESNMDFVTYKLFVPNIIIIDSISRWGSMLFLKFIKNKIIDNKLNEQIQLICNAFPEKELEPFIRQKVVKFIIAYKLYTFILRRRNPRNIYLTNYIHKHALIYSAKKLNIKTIEIQHGFITPLFSDYHFPGVIKDSLLLFPEVFYYLSENLKYKVELPLSDFNIKPFQGVFFSEKLKRSKLMEKDSKAILFISTNYKEFLIFIEDFCRLLESKGENLHIYFKPHPYEYSYIDMNYIANLKIKYNLNFINKNEDIYEYLGKIKYIVTVQSTLLFEAIDYGNTVYCIKLKDYETVIPFINDRIVHLVENTEDLYNAIEKDFSK